MWLHTSKLNLSPDNCSLIMNVDNRTIRGLFDRFDQFFVPLISGMNDEMQLGGLGEDVEMDEISFRSVTVEDKVHWIRFLACAKRGSSFVHLYKLPNPVTASGQGGGGPLSLEELGPALRVGTQRPLLKVGSVVHTDSAKAYKHLSEDEVLHTWMVNGALASFEDLKLGHTKPPIIRNDVRWGFSKSQERCNRLKRRQSLGMTLGEGLANPRRGVTVWNAANH